MEKTKMTNVKALQYVAENCELPADVAEKIGNILATYTKKSATSADRKPTATQVENAKVGEEVVAWLNDHRGEKFTAGDILKNCPVAAALPSVQRLTPILTKAAEANLIAKTVDKRRNYYSAI